MTDSPSQARRLLRASVGQAGATIWSALLGLISAPLLIHHLGASSYGVFALIGLVSSYLVNLEFGFGHSTVRFLAHARARGDAEDEQAVIGNSLLIFLPATGAAAGLTFFGAPFIVRHFAHGQPALHQTFLTSVHLAAAIVGIAFLSSLWSSALQALGHLRVLIHTNWIFGTLLSASSVAIAVTGGGLIWILRAQIAVQGALSLTLMACLSRATAAHLIPLLDRRKLREMANFAGHTLLAGIGSQILSQGPAAVLAGYSTTAQLAVFSVPRTVLQQVDGLVGSTSLGFLPFASAASADTDTSRIRSIFAANLRLTILIVAPLTCFIAAFAHPLLVAWVGTSFADQATTPLRLLAGASLFWGLGPPPADLARGFGRPSLVSAYTVVGAIATTAIAFAAVPADHAAGAAFAICVGGSLATIPFIFVVAKLVLGMSVRQLSHELWRPVSALVLAALLSTGGLIVSDTFVGAVMTGTVGGIVYLGFTAKLVLDEQERRVLLSVLHRRHATAVDQGSPTTTAGTAGS